MMKVSHKANSESGVPPKNMGYFLKIIQPQIGVAILNSDQKENT